MMKRSMEDREVEALAMANCLMLLARVGKNSSGITSTDRVFECKTCKKSFTSFQALGGHRASHKKPRLMENVGDVSVATPKVTVAKPKVHECSICGQSFPMGQALGGHMRRHRAAPQASIVLVTNDDHKRMEKVIPVLKRCNSKRIILDLNLTPYENELELEKIAPALGCF